MAAGFQAKRSTAAKHDVVKGRTGKSGARRGGSSGRTGDETFVASGKRGYFAAENFSYLWGALGVAGLRGTDAAARRKIWQVLKENGVPDAFEKEYSEILRGNWRRGIKTTGCGHGTGLIIFRPELSFRKRYWKNWQNMIKNLKKMFYHIVLIIKN